MPVVEINPLVAAGPAFVGWPLWKKELRMGSLAINIDRLWNDIKTLATFSAGDKGVNRLTFSDEDRAARAYLRAQMVSVGFEVVEIPPGIMLGRLNPLSRPGPAVMSGCGCSPAVAVGNTVFSL